MLKRMSIKKIMVSTAAVLLLLIIYLIPDNRKEIELKNKDIEYTYNNIFTINIIISLISIYIKYY